MQVHQGMQYGAPAASVYQQPQQYVPIPQHQQNEQLRQFWLQQHSEIQEVGTDPAEFKNHQLPLARIKKARHTAAHCPSSAEIPILYLFCLHKCGPTAVTLQDAHAIKWCMAADHEER